MRVSRDVIDFLHTPIRGSEKAPLRTTAGASIFEVPHFQDPECGSVCLVSVGVYWEDNGSTLADREAVQAVFQIVEVRPFFCCMC